MRYGTQKPNGYLQTVGFFYLDFNGTRLPIAPENIFWTQDLSLTQKGQYEAFVYRACRHYKLSMDQAASGARITIQTSTRL